MERHDFRQVIDGFLRIEKNFEELETLVRSDHDLLLRLDQQFREGFSTYKSRVDDHEKRIRFLERIAFGLLAVIILLQFVVSKILK